MDMAYALALAFGAGMLVKAVDWLDDDKKSGHPVKYVLAIAYGLAIGYLMSASAFALMFMGALVAQVFARKIDTTAHSLGFFVAALCTLVFGFPPFEPAIFGFFFLAAFLDEADYIGRLRPLTQYRPFLKIGSLVPAIWGAWQYFFAIMLFDIGYTLFAFAAKSIGSGKETHQRRQPGTGYRKTRNPKPQTP